MVQSSRIDEELSLIESIPSLQSLIPQYLSDYFKKDLNESILRNLLSELDHLIESIDANNSFRILSINEDEATLSHSHANNVNNISVASSANSSQSLLISATSCKTLLLDIATRLVALFDSYSRRIRSHFARFDVYSAKYADLKFASQDELLIYQRAILVDRFSSKHYRLFNLLFKNVFDNFQRLSGGSGEADDEEEEEESLDACDQTLIQQFHQINRIL